MNPHPHNNDNNNNNHKKKGLDILAAAIFHELEVVYYETLIDLFGDDEKHPRLAIVVKFNPCCKKRRADTDYIYDRYPKVLPKIAEIKAAEGRWVGFVNIDKSHGSHFHTIAKIGCEDKFYHLNHHLHELGLY